MNGLRCPVCGNPILQQTDIDPTALTATFSVAHPQPVEPACYWVLETLAMEQQQIMETIVRGSALPEGGV